MLMQVAQFEARSPYTIVVIECTELYCGCMFVVALSGAHTIGHVHASGYNGHPGADMGADPTVNAWDATPTLFDNGYFTQLLNIVTFFVFVFSELIAHYLAIILLSRSHGLRSPTT